MKMAGLAAVVMIIAAMVILSSAMLLRLLVEMGKIPNEIVIQNEILES